MCISECKTAHQSDLSPLALRVYARACIDRLGISQTCMSTDKVSTVRAARSTAAAKNDHVRIIIVPGPTALPLLSDPRPTPTRHTLRHGGRTKSQADS